MIRRAPIVTVLAALVAGGSSLALPTTVAAADQAEAVQASSAGSSLSISPLRMEIDRTADGATMYLSNTSTRELAVQSRVFGWSQADGRDVYAPSADLTVSPSISIIPPGQTQIVRVLRKAGASQGEKRFRLAVDQLPDPTSQSSGQAATRIRFTVPVFVDRDTAQPAALAWRLFDDRLELANTGGATARVLELSMKTAAGAEVALERNSLRYIHGNSTITWPLGKGCSLGTVRVTARVDGQAVDAQPVPSCG